MLHLKAVDDVIRFGVRGSSFHREWRDLETGGRGRSRSLKMAPFNRSYTNFCWSAIVAVCCTIFKLLDVEYNHDLEKVIEGHSNWYHSKAWVRFPICLP